MKSESYNSNGKESLLDTAQKMKFSIMDFFGKCDQIGRKLWIWSHLLKKSVMENFIFCAVGKEKSGMSLTTVSQTAC